ncbi:right-handed parallel beta-helix repeat-containing protein [Nocardiopsis sp. CT-R113]|uniref:Right-handed parallel beta-helix repeat-containing protein n=1 Tax=Nocardiopsis codii TaxID=3065942 RepID=A0ABU7KCN4_9ACTN|nr:right-handed parallel beta-helix repeat-containing protein [Nocardiopsis sp. CT-R113]MEE2039996.1 right-handed parallel beta-helix repeat-containing protein [Nocardiopsis sp. CT-R113]
MSTPKRTLAAAGGLALAASVLVAPSPAAAADPFADAPVGYASMNGGTDGGYGGSTVHEYVLSEYASWSTESTPGQALYELLNDHQDNEGDGLVVHVDVTVTPDQVDESKIDVKDVSNVSILGVGDSGEFDGIGFKLSRSHNVVFRNLAIHHVSQGEGDALEVASESSNVWIDHNEFYSELDGVDKDHYDGLVDIKHGSEYVTVSWNTFTDHWKTSLVGHNDSASSAPDFITYHHNLFSNLNTRVPLVRHADVHMLNNVFEDIGGSAVNARMGARILVEGNSFDNVGSGEEDGTTGQVEGPVGWWYGSSETGYWNLVDNAFTDSPSDHLESTTDFTVPYPYDAETPAQARESVAAHAGTGVVDVTP